MTDQIVQDVREIAAKTLGVPVTLVETDTSIRELPGVESIKMLQIIAKVERKYGVQFEDEIIFSIGTIVELASLVEARLTAVAAAQ